jgi:glycosyltransferase involved in cell wall biosynthesis
MTGSAETIPHRDAARRLLILAYHFPPIGGAGVQRPTKFVHHLPRVGYMPVVVTGPGTSTGRWTPRDDSLAAEVDPDLEVLRVKEKEPVEKPWRSRGERWFRLPITWDRWWLEGVTAAAAAAPAIEAVYAVMPPWSSSEAAAAIARERGIPWIADLGDPWALDEMMVYPSAFHRRLERARMRNALSSAAAIIMSTPVAVERLLAAFPELCGKPVFAVPNGFDRRDFTSPPPRREDGTFRIVHTGYLHTELGRSHRRLAPLRQLLGGAIAGADVLTRSHVYLLEALELLFGRRPELRSVVELHLAGVLSARDREVAERSSEVRLHGYLPHADSVALLRSADMLFLPLHNVREGERAAIVPGKTYEYVAAERPILAAVPDGDARDILTEAGNAFICRPDDVEAMARAVEQCLERGSAVSSVPSDLLERFEYGTLVRRVAHILDQVCAPSWARRVVADATAGAEPRVAPRLRQRSRCGGRRVLYLAYNFPPIGGGGVQRSLKFVRYLPEYGYDPIVVTGPGRALEGRWTPDDASLASEVPPQVEVIRAAGPEPPTATGWRGRGERWLWLPSRWDRWWVGAAVAAGSKVRDVDLIHATLSPWSSAVVAAELSRRLGRPWTVGLRDPWALDEMMVFPTAVHRRRELMRMRHVLSSASGIVMNTPEAAERLSTHFPELAEKPIYVIPNGFDVADFAATPPERSDGKFRIVHTGYLHTELGRKQHQLAMMRRVFGGEVRGVDILTRSHVYLLDAIERLLARTPDLASVVEVHLAGVLSEGDRAVARRLPLVKELGYLPHSESVALVRSADLLFLPMQNLPPGQRATIVPGKTYEYLAAGRPIMAAVPDGDAQDLLRDAGHDLIVRPDDVAGMATALETAVERWRKGVAQPAPPPGLLERFERKNLTEELAWTFDMALGTDEEAAQSPAELIAVR